MSSAMQHSADQVVGEATQSQIVFRHSVHSKTVRTDMLPQDRGHVHISCLEHAPADLAQRYPVLAGLAVLGWCSTAALGVDECL